MDRDENNESQSPASDGVDVAAPVVQATADALNFITAQRLSVEYATLASQIDAVFHPDNVLISLMSSYEGDFERDTLVVRVVCDLDPIKFVDASEKIFKSVHAASPRLFPFIAVLSGN